jgi:hypothetical protein
MDENVSSYLEQEFRPLDSDQVDWLLNIASKLVAMEDDPNLSIEHKSLLNIASHQIVRLTSMTLAGFQLYSSWHAIATRLHNEILLAVEESILGYSNIEDFQFSTLPTTIEQIEVIDNEL